MYVDYSFPLNQYTIEFPDNSGGSIDVIPPAAPPPGFPAILSPNGIVVGDLIYLSNPKGAAMAEVTGINVGGTVLTFANLDPLNINQSAAASGNVKYIDPCLNAGNPACFGGGSPDTTTKAYRAYAITYFVEVPAAAGQTPRLMRQVNAQAAVPVADNIIDLQLTFDMCTATPTPGCSNQPDPVGAGYSPNSIEKINISITGQSLTNYGNKSKSMSLVTSVSARNLTFKNRYN